MKKRMKDKTKFKVFALSIFLGLSPVYSFGFEDCFNYRYIRNDMTKYDRGWEILNAFRSNKDNLILKKRWPTVNLKLTPTEEKARFGTTGLEVAQRTYLAQHFDGTDVRMSVALTVERAQGVRKVKGWRVEKNPPMPEEYLDPAYPESKKKGLDWSIMVHWTYPPDIRGSGILVWSYNNKDRDQDTWIWFPSLRKVRRLTPANGDDYLAGSYKTFSNCMLRRITDEEYQIIGETKGYVFYCLTNYDYIAMQHKYAPHSPEFDRFMRGTIQPRECWVVRSISVKGGYCDYYKTRIWLADKEWGYGPCLEEYYSEKGKAISSHQWFYMRQTGYDGKIGATWTAYDNDLNFEDWGFSLWNGPEWGSGYDNPDDWFTLRELQRSVPTDYIPYMPVLPPRKLLPLEDILSSKELQEAYRKKFQRRTMEYPGELRF
ncbi:MAG: outer membrane lipoprotein-sorting protein [Thermodesulfobacteriota bacterium]|nr:outer membrane lipoprotein-sorting protein [Thermodesulfobacteriota bacterium]